MGCPAWFDDASIMGSAVHVREDGILEPLTLTKWDRGRDIELLRAIKYTACHRGRRPAASRI
jgi:hypothetical protein